MYKDFNQYNQIAYKIELLFHFIRNIIQPLNKVTYIFVTSPIVIYCHVSIVQPTPRDNIIWGLDTYTNYYTTLSSCDFNYYSTRDDDYKMLVHKKSILGLSRFDDVSFEIIKLENYIAF